MPIVNRRAAAQPTVRGRLSGAKRVSAPAPRAQRAPIRRAGHDAVTAGLRPIRSKLTQGELFESVAAELADTRHPVDQKQVKAVLDSFFRHVYRSVMPGGAGKFVYPAVFTVEATKVPARKVPARKAGEYPNPFNGGAMEWREAKAAFTKPATVKCKMRPQRRLKSAALGE